MDSTNPEAPMFGFRIGNVVRKWEEEHNGVPWFYVEHVRDGQKVISYSNYANPADSYTSPLERASSSDTSITSPFVSK
jgi:hypothetical protein